MKDTMTPKECALFCNDLIYMIAENAQEFLITDVLRSAQIALAVVAAEIGGLDLLQSALNTCKKAG